MPAARGSVVPRPRASLLAGRGRSEPSRASPFPQLRRPAAGASKTPVQV